MLSRLIVLLVLVSEPTVSLASPQKCAIYPIHNAATLSKDTSSLVDMTDCSNILPKIDTDLDGLSDWKINQKNRKTILFVANDSDIDGDGIENEVDEDPFKPNINTFSSVFPKHLLQGPSKRVSQNKQLINKQQISLWKKTRIIAINLKNWHSDRILGAINTIIDAGLADNGLSNLTHLKYIIADNSISQNGSQAYYSRNLQALIVGNDKFYFSTAENFEREYEQLMLTLIHEIGHAFVFSSLNPESLYKLALNFGPWKTQQKNKFINDFFWQGFFRKNPLSSAPSAHLDLLKNTPSRYSLSNIHEWFAECFTVLVAQRLVEEGRLGRGWMKQPRRLKPLTNSFAKKLSGLKANDRNQFLSLLKKAAGPSALTLLH